MPSRWHAVRSRKFLSDSEGRSDIGGAALTENPLAQTAANGCLKPTPAVIEPSAAAVIETAVVVKT